MGVITPIAYCGAILVLVSFFANYYPSLAPIEEFNPESYCPISPKFVPVGYDNIKPTLDYLLKDPEFRVESAKRFSGAIQIPTEITDKSKYLSVDDPFFEPFIEFHAYLEKTYPKVHKSLTKETVNKHALVYTWQGSDPSLKPLLFTAHQDVVPVEWNTAFKWTHEPYSGFYDGDKIWGRGSSDCKNLLISLMESVEFLLAEGYSPKRTVILAFGFDEEASGVIGASHIADFLFKRYGPDSIYGLIDEGSTGLAYTNGRYFMVAGTGEKGYLDSYISLKTPGGHSSVPPDHTTIGIMTQLASLIESSPFEPKLIPENPYLGYLQCYASYSEGLDPKLRKDIFRSPKDPKSTKNVLDFLRADKFTRYLVETSQAIDIMKGGVKVNALPESVEMVINSRINIGSSVSDTVDKLAGNLLTIAEKFDLGVIVDGKELKKPTQNGYFNYTWTAPLEYSPVTPWLNDFWFLITGTMRHFYEDVAYPDVIKKPVVASPGIMTGNTDTRYYWNLTKNIYRYSPGVINPAAGFTGIHSVDEFAYYDSHLNGIAFFYEYIKNVDTFAAKDKQ